MHDSGHVTNSFHITMFNRFFMGKNLDLFIIALRCLIDIGSKGMGNYNRVIQIKLRHNS